MSKEKLNVVITGASSGIGEAIALDLAKNKHHLFLTARNEERLKNVATKADELGARVHYALGDTSKSEDVDKIFAYVEKAFDGKVDVIVANAGVGFFGNLETLTEEQYDAQFDTNVKGVFLWLRKVLPGMRKQNRGQIIVISSDMGFNTGPRASLYSATKHAIQAMVSSLRRELKGTLVKAATINPGSVDTPWFDGKDVDRSTMLAVTDVSQAARFIIEQKDTSNIDHIHLLPGKR